MTTLSVVATIKAKPGHEAEFESTAQELVAASRTEPGVLDYRLCRLEPGTYVFVERYRDEAAVEEHRRSPHFRTIGKRLGEHMEGPPSLLRLQDIV